MRSHFLPFFILPFLGQNNPVTPAPDHCNLHINTRTDTGSADTWRYFLQHLPETDGPILDYQGRPVDYQKKHTKVIKYDVGKKDLQQCADALMRLRAEYLFARKRYDEIGFHFVSGHYYSWKSYCNGIKPFVKGNTLKFIKGNTFPQTHASLRQYLDIVYTYASTISLAKELKNTNQFDIGTVIISPGSPGHCFIITDKKMNESGEEIYKLAEGYTPAQSIYILRNLEEEDITPWHRLKKGKIETASYVFTNYQMKKFE